MQWGFLMIANFPYHSFKKLDGRGRVPFVAIIMLVFAEITPKTYAAMKPERVAFPASVLLKPLQVLLAPLVWMVNGVSMMLLRLGGIRPQGLDFGVGERLLPRLDHHLHGHGLLAFRHALSLVDVEDAGVGDQGLVGANDRANEIPGRRLGRHQEREVAPQRHQGCRQATLGNSRA